MERSTTTRNRARQRGMSLIELSLALGVAAALVSTGVPALSNALQQQRLASTTQELLTAVQLARSEAITRGARVVLAAKAPGNWAAGWRVFADDNDDGELDAGEALLREWTPAADGIKISAHFSARHGGDALSFSPIGVVRRPGSDGLVLGRITLSVGDQSRALCFSSLTMRPVNAARCS